MARAAAAASCALCLVTGVGASLADRVAGRGGGWDGVMPWEWNRTASFGMGEGQRSEEPRGTVMFSIGNERSGPVYFQAVRWTTSGMTIPKSLIQEVCGSLPEKQTFTYSINQKWSHGSRRSFGVGDQCAERYTGRHWDPSAACGPASGNPACDHCETRDGYRCQPSTFDPRPDASGSFAYRFLNRDACELGDLSGMHGELEAGAAVECFDHHRMCAEWAERGDCTSRRSAEYMDRFCQKSCGVCEAAKGDAADFVALRALTNESGAAAQMSVPFGEISRRSVTTNLIGINCDASGPPPAHRTNCGCIRDIGEDRSPSIGTLTVFIPWDKEVFYMAGPEMDQLEGRSLVLQCGSTFGDRAGAPVACAALQ